MKEIRKILSAVLALVMLFSLLAFPGGVSFAADEEDGVLNILAAEKEEDVSKVMPKLKANSDFVKNNKYSAKWALTGGYGTVSATNLPKDISAYNELKLVLYANMESTMYVYFDTDNPETDGLDSFSTKLTLKEGWQTISIDFNKLSKGRSPSWKNIRTPLPGIPICTATLFTPSLLEPFWNSRC